MATHVETYHYDNARTGWNKREKHLTPANVGSPKFGLLFEQSVDDMVFAQPLYVEGLRIKKHKRNVVFVGTEAGTIYAFDADKPNGGNPLWTRSLVNAAAGETGPGVTLGVITATPAIDVARRRMYVIGYLKDKSNNLFFRLHAIALADGNDVVNPAVLDQNTIPQVPGTGEPTNTPGMIYFDPAQHFNRAALLLDDGRVYVGFASHGDNPVYHGWVMGFHTKNLKLIGPPYCSTPDASQSSGGLDDPEIGGSFWQSGWGLAADGDGYIYGMTGNGLFIDPAKPHPPRNYADSLVKLTSKLKLVGSFTPDNYAVLASNDTDFGSGGPLVIPDKADKGRKEVIGCGKFAKVYLVDRKAMTPAKLHQTGNQLDQLALVTSPNATSINPSGQGPGVWGGPAYYGGPLGTIVYYCGDHGPLQAITIKKGKLSPHMIAPGVPNQTSMTDPNEAFPNEGGTIPVVTSNGSKRHTGVVWVVTRPDSTGLHLRAYDAENLAKPHLFDAVIGNWSSGSGAFLAPVVINGKVYVASDHKFTVYGIT